MMNLILLFVIIFLIGLIIYLYSPKKDDLSLKKGDRAPDFKLRDENERKRSLSEFKGSKVVLYFYPKDNTPGCTLQACAIRDTYKLFQEHEITVIGINYDSPAAHKAFKKKYDLPFILLSDEEKKVAKKYGAYVSVLNNLYPERKTFLIDEKGHIINIVNNVDISTHTTDILVALGISQNRQEEITSPPTV